MAVGDPVQIVAPTCIRLTYKHLYTNGRHMDCIMDVSFDELADRATGIALLLQPLSTAWQDNILFVMANNVTYQGMNWIDLDSLDGSSGFQPPTAGHATAGGSTDAALAPNVAYLVHKSCEAHRGERQGRMYLPGPVETEVDEDGKVSSTKQAQINTKLTAYKDAVTDLSDLLSLETIAPRVIHVHKHRSDDPDDWDWSSSTINSLTVDTVVATQRRRLR